MANSKAISTRIPDELLEKIDQLAEEKYKSHKGTPNRSLVVLDAIVAYFDILSDTTNSKDLGLVSDSVSIVEFNELRDTVFTLSDTIENLQNKLIALSDSVLKLNEDKLNSKVDKKSKHTQLSTMSVSDAVIDNGLTATQLAERISSTKQLVSKAKGRYPETPSKFISWARKQDPDGFGWEYREESRLFHKVEPLA